MPKEGTGAMTINLQKPDITELKPRITVFGVGGGGGNAVNNMINAGLRASISLSPIPTPRR
jgi:cell division GTPase FtsZ